MEIKEKSSKDLKLMIIGNKSDLKDARQVSNEEALRKAQDTGIALMETSALDSTNVKEAFHDLLKEMYIEISAKIAAVEESLNDNKEALQLETNDGKKKGCC